MSCFHNHNYSLSAFRVAPDCACKQFFFFFFFFLLGEDPCTPGFDYGLTTPKLLPPALFAAGGCHQTKILTSLTGQNAFNDNTWELMALPVQLGGLGIPNPSASEVAHHDASNKITAPLTALIVEQSHQYPNTTKVEQL